MNIVCLLLPPFFWKTCVLELQNEMPDELFQSQFQLQTFWGACPINRSRLVFDTMQQKSEASPLVVAHQDTHSIIARFYSWCHLLNIYHFIFWRQKHARIVEKKDKRWNSWRRINSGRTTIITVVGHSNKKYKKKQRNNKNKRISRLYNKVFQIVLNIFFLIELFWIKYPMIFFGFPWTKIRISPKFKYFKIKIYTII